MRRCLGILLIMAMGGGVAACSTSLAPSSPPVAETPAVKPPPPRPETVRRPEPAAPAPVAPIPAPVTPETLTGMDRGQAIALLGRPVRETSRVMGTEWSYGHGNCRLSLVFYPEVESNVERVLGYEFAGGTDPATCLNRLRKSGTSHGQ